MYDDSDFIETNDRFAPEAAVELITLRQAADDPKPPLTTVPIDIRLISKQLHDNSEDHTSRITELLR